VLEDGLGGGGTKRPRKSLQGKANRAFAGGRAGARVASAGEGQGGDATGCVMALGAVMGHDGRHRHQESGRSARGGRVACVRLSPARSREQPSPGGLTAHRGVPDEVQGRTNRVFVPEADQVQGRINGVLGRASGQEAG
jgi:hypothetical protein